MRRLIRRLCSVTVAAPLCLGAVAEASAPQTPGTAAVSETAADAIRAHLDEAEDALDALLEWRHVLSDVSRQSAGAPKPTSPATTLVTLDRADVQRVVELVNAAAAAVPAASPSPTMPRGDLAAHLATAREIARELMPGTAGAVGTSGGNTITIDRTALLRMEIELEAAERVAPRRLTAAPAGQR